jgi:hypothetical protein
MYFRPEVVMTATSSLESTGSTLVEETPLDFLPRRVASLLSQPSASPSPVSIGPDYDALLERLTEKSNECEKLNHRLSRLALGAQKPVICEDFGVQTSNDSITDIDQEHSCTSSAFDSGEKQVVISDENPDFQTKIAYFERFAQTETSPTILSSAPDNTTSPAGFDSFNIIDGYL